MRTKEQIEIELEKLKAQLDDPDLSIIAGMSIFERAHTLKWVLEDDTKSEE